MASQILRRVVGSRSTRIPTPPSNPSSLLPALGRAFSSNTPITATLFPGDGIGPEIAESVKQVSFSAHRQLSSVVSVLCKFSLRVHALGLVLCPCECVGFRFLMMYVMCSRGLRLSEVIFRNLTVFRVGWNWDFVKEPELESIITEGS